MRKIYKRKRECCTECEKSDGRMAMENNTEIVFSSYFSVTNEERRKRGSGTELEKFDQARREAPKSG